MRWQLGRRILSRLRKETGLSPVHAKQAGLSARSVARQKQGARSHATLLHVKHSLGPTSLIQTGSAGAQLWRVQRQTLHSATGPRLALRNEAGDVAGCLSKLLSLFPFALNLTSTLCLADHRNGKQADLEDVHCMQRIEAHRLQTRHGHTLRTYGFPCFSGTEGSGL